jgi:Arc/MetJ-type ribon-helix-helix transcriptional regulator
MTRSLRFLATPVRGRVGCDCVQNSQRLDHTGARRPRAQLRRSGRFASASEVVRAALRLLSAMKDKHLISRRRSCGRQERTDLTLRVADRNLFGGSPFKRSDAQFAPFMEDSIMSSTTDKIKGATNDAVGHVKEGGARRLAARSCRPRGWPRKPRAKRKRLLATSRIP